MTKRVSRVFLAVVVIGFLCAAIVLKADEARALSCIEVTPKTKIGMIHRAADDIGALIAVKGSLSFKEEDFKFMSEAENPPEMAGQPYKIIEAHVSGFDILDDTEFDRDIQIKQFCVGSWCGRVEPFDDGLIFLAKTLTGYELHLQACPENVFTEYSKKVIAKFRKCYEEKDCE